MKRSLTHEEHTVVVAEFLCKSILTTFQEKQKAFKDFIVSTKVYPKVEHDCYLFITFFVDKQKLLYFRLT